MGKDVLLIGIGQTGCTVAELFSHKMNSDGLSVTCMAMDTDETVNQYSETVHTFPMTDEGVLDSVVEALGSENVKAWFPCDWTADCTDFAKTLRMNAGANQWRMKAYLSFASFMSKQKYVDRLHAALDAFYAACENESGPDVYVVASLAGGTGSALFLPVSMYIKKYVEEKGSGKGTFRAILVMPDVYEDSYCAEQRVKAYANTYAALREYHAVLCCAYSHENAQKGDKHPPISFKIGSEDGIFGLLFDSERPEYCVPEANPFDDVYLFERVPGVNSVGAHAEIIADILVSLCKCTAVVDATNVASKASDAIFGGFSFLKVNYPLDSTVSYIANRQTCEMVLDEITFVQKRVNEIFKRMRGEARLYGATFLEGTDEYVRAFIEVADDIFHEHPTHGALLGRNEQQFTDDPTGVDVETINYMPILHRHIMESISCEASEELEGIISAPLCVGPKKGVSKKEFKIETAEVARKYGELLTATYRYGIDATINKKQEFIQAMLAPSEDPEGPSLVNHLLMKDGKYLHPVYALLRLCLLYQSLSPICKGKEDGSRVQDTSPEATLPEELLRITEGFSSSKYAKLGDERFKDLIYDTNEKYAKQADDRALLTTDMSSVYTRIQNKLKAYQYANAYEAVGELIKRYRALITVVGGMEEEWLSDTQLALINASEPSGNIITVGTTVERKRSVYDEYVRLYKQDASCVAAYTEAMGRAMSEAIDGHDPEASWREDAMGVLNTMKEGFADRCKHSDYYRIHMDKNILSVILESHENDKLSFSRVFKARPVSLHVKFPDRYSEYRLVRNTASAILDDKIADYISEHAEDFANKAPQEYIEQLMYAAGEYSGKAMFADRIGEKSMILRCESTNMRPYFVEAIDELGVDPKGYKCYEKALTNMRTYSTQMWNPHLVYTRGDVAQLPYINPDRQRAYESDICRAVLCALDEGDLYIDELPEGGRAYFVRIGLANDPLLMGEEPVMEADPTSVLVWALRHPKWVNKYAQRLKDREAAEIRHIPTQGVDHLNNAVISAAIDRATVVRVVNHTAMALISDLLEQNDTDPFGYVRCLAGLAHEVLLDFCHKGYRDENEYFMTVYNRRLHKAANALAASRGTDRVKEVMAQLNALGYFKSYQSTGALCDYVFEELPQQDAQCI